MQKRLIRLLCCIVAMLLLTSCGAAVSNQPEFNESAVMMDTEFDTVENADFRMTLNHTNYGVTVTKLSTGEVWGTSPIDLDGPKFDELGMPITNHPQVESALKVIARNAEFRTDDVLLSYTDSVQEDNVSVKKNDTGFTVEYYFDSMKIMVPVDYELLADSVRISVDPTKIEENENRVVKISLAPFCTSAKNDKEDSYLFIPSGSGAVVEAKTYSSTGITYSEQVYGDDGTIEKEIISTNRKAVRLPVYGSKNENAAMFAIIEDSAESAFITADIGSSQYGYSSVYATFQLRGYTNHTAKLFSSSVVKNYLYAAPMITEKVSVRFFPLSGENADYSGMAKIYRDYLEATYGEVEQTEEHALNLSLIGGKMITKSFLGIPYKTISALTTFSDAKEIVSNINDKIQGDLQVKLVGYTANGIDIGEVGGGFELNKKFGSNSEINEFTELCKNSGIDIYMDYDLINFNKNGNGFSVGKNASINVGELKAVQYDYDIASKNKIESSAYYLLSPECFAKATDKLLKKTNKLPFDGISLASLTNTSYSDYRNKDNPEYYSKSGMTNKAVEAFKTVKESGKKLLSTDANLYAAIMSDAVVEVPNISSKEYPFSYDIPFYSMVMKGRLPLYGESINYSSNSDDALLHAIEGGTGIGYTVTEEWNNELINSQNVILYNTKFSDLETEIIDNTLKIADYLKKVDGSAIKSHRILSSGLRETIFENGVMAYVNYGDTSADTPYGEVSAHNYLVLEKLS